MISRLCAVDCAATSERIEKQRNASLIESVPSAESLRPVKGSLSGPRWHCVLILMRETWLARGSTSRAIFSGSRPKTLNSLLAV